MKWNNGKSIKYLGEKHTNSTQTFQTGRRQHVPDQHYLHTKNQRYYKKRKLQTNVTHEYTHKNSHQKNISKSTLEIYKRDNIHQMESITGM